MLGWGPLWPQGDRVPRLSCSDDEDVAPLSAKFADIYPLSNYDDTEVVANMNGIHSELHGGGENMALKDEVCAWLLHGHSQRRGMVGWRSVFLCFWFTKCTFLNAVLKSPQVSSTTSSSSEADDEDVDAEGSGEPPGAPKEDAVLGSGSPRKEESKVGSPPPSYPAQQVGFYFFQLPVLPRVSFSVFISSNKHKHYEIQNYVILNNL